MHTTEYQPKPLEFETRTEAELATRANQFLSLMQKRRTVRDFATTPVPQCVIEDAIAAASTAPSGANMQPWYFVAVQSATLKRQIRLSAEEEERKLYGGRASDEWLEALSPLGTTAEKPFLELAPWLIAVFAQKFTLDASGRKRKHYYTPESVGIATGLLITALHHAGLATLTHTPSPMGFLREILKRPAHEKPFLLLVTGYPAEKATVPEIEKKPLDAVLTVL